MRDAILLVIGFIAGCDVCMIARMWQMERERRRR